MRQVPMPLIEEFNTSLVKNNIPQRNQSHYLKWLRYYFDFCYKYGLKESDSQSLSDYIDKLKEKKQTAAQQQQAVKAINIYYSLIQSQSERPQKKPAQQSDKTMVVQETRG